MIVQAHWNWYFVRKIFAGSGIWTQDLATDICFLARHLHISGNFLWISNNPWQHYRTLNFKIKKPSPNHLGSKHHRDGRIITSVSHFLLLLLLQWRQNKARGRMSPLFLSLGWAQAFKVSIARANVYVHVANLDPWQIVLWKLFNSDFCHFLRLASCNLFLLFHWSW